MNQDTTKAGSDFLEHHGIKGMRWGVRRTDAQLARAQRRKELEGVKADTAKTKASGEQARESARQAKATTKAKEIQNKNAANAPKEAKAARKASLKAQKAQAKADAEKAKAQAKADKAKAKAEEAKNQEKTSTDRKRVSSMSDTELKKTVDRMNMEKKYKDLTKPPPSIAEKTTKLFLDVGNQVARQQLTNLGNQYAGRALNDLLGGRRNAPTLPKLTTPPDPATRVTG